jgi:hypothetical protein
MSAVETKMGVFLRRQMHDSGLDREFWLGKFNAWSMPAGVVKSGLKREPEEG